MDDPHLPPPPPGATPGGSSGARKARGRRAEATRRRAPGWALGIVLVATAMPVPLFLQVLEQRYVENVELAVSSSTGIEVVPIDGEPREDRESTDDGYLECADDPQPTLVTREDAPTP